MKLSSFLTGYWLVFALQIYAQEEVFTNINDIIPSPNNNPEAPSWVANVTWLITSSKRPGEQFHLRLPYVYKFTSTQRTIDLKTNHHKFATCKMYSGEEIVSYSELQCEIGKAASEVHQADGYVVFSFTFNAGGSGEAVTLEAARNWHSGENTIKWLSGNKELQYKVHFNAGNARTVQDADTGIFMLRKLVVRHVKKSFFFGSICSFDGASGTLTLENPTPGFEFDCSLAYGLASNKINDFVYPQTDEVPQGARSEIYICSPTKVVLVYTGFPKGYRPYVVVDSAVSNDVDVLQLVTYTIRGYCGSKDIKASRSVKYRDYQDRDADSTGTIKPIVVTTVSGLTNSETEVVTLTGEGTDTIVVELPTTTAKSSLSVIIALLSVQHSLLSTHLNIHLSHEGVLVSQSQSLMLISSTQPDSSLHLSRQSSPSLSSSSSAMAPTTNESPVYSATLSTISLLSSSGSIPASLSKISESSMSAGLDSSGITNTIGAISGISESTIPANVSTSESGSTSESVPITESVSENFWNSSLSMNSPTLSSVLCTNLSSSQSAEPLYSLFNPYSSESTEVTLLEYSSLSTSTGVNVSYELSFSEVSHSLESVLKSVVSITTSHMSEVGFTSVYSESNQNSLTEVSFWNGSSSLLHPEISSTDARSDAMISTAMFSSSLSSSITSSGNLLTTTIVTHASKVASIIPQTTITQGSIYNETGEAVNIVHDEQKISTAENDHVQDGSRDPGSVAFPTSTGEIGAVHNSLASRSERIHATCEGECITFKTKETLASIGVSHHTDSSYNLISRLENNSNRITTNELVALLFSIVDLLF